MTEVWPAGRPWGRGSRGAEPGLEAGDRPGARGKPRGAEARTQSAAPGEGDTPGPRRHRPARHGFEAGGLRGAARGPPSEIEGGPWLGDLPGISSPRASTPSRAQLFRTNLCFLAFLRCLELGSPWEIMGRVKVFNLGSTRGKTEGWIAGVWLLD